MPTSPSSVRELKRKLKRGPKLSRKELAAYMLGLMDAGPGTFHHPWHSDKPGEPRCRPQIVPKPILDLLQRIPDETIITACAELGHPSFWLRPGSRYLCICGETSYKD